MSSSESAIAQRLRSQKSASESPLPETRFLYDDQLASQGKHIVLNLRYNIATDHNNPIRSNGSAPELSKHNSKITIRKPFPALRNVRVDDPLRDSVFESFHRRMHKEEKTMLNAEQMRILAEVGYLNELLDALCLDYWMSHLPRLCRMSDSPGIKEYEIKRDLTIDYIKRSIRKHVNWKRRFSHQHSVLKTICRHNSHTVQTGKQTPKNEAISDEQRKVDEYSTDVRLLAERKRRDRESQYGAKLRIDLHNGYVIAIDPLLPPRLLRKEPCPTQYPITPSLTPKQNVRSAEITETDTAKKSLFETLSRRSLVRVSMRNDANMALGMNLQNIERSEFTLPYTITGDAKDWA